jgi:hypothetical protein
LFGMSGKQVCEDGRTENHGVRAEFLAVFSPTERWRASEEEVNLFRHQLDEWAERLQTVDEEATRIKIWMVKDQTDTDTNQTD